eukprot:Protomagalhaensia_sp_Gyna_25__94@NODE_1048_length_2254_cov_171_526411_g835_i0_p1_GENE_NODE_1048_length_2254_cov_171_526411_g835_i0NODE_1048_length_2254_cov_171_526411_g835_i0_p1_ORF_typecomplete_len534_score83_76MFS_1/PF07690_16/1_7e03MFS_1/PF07690_16/4e15MFS_1/PF07690_16/7_7e08Sugar_tr/PF00083_24/4_7e02Sugar_tr/PF00083_24/2_3e10_NODE_1048_length_2254_cov_171_526411_g835_i04322033
MTAILQVFLTGITNKWIQVIIYTIACLTTCCIYYGWQPFSAMMFHSGAYEWRCTTNDIDDPDGLVLCTEQDKAVTLLYSIAAGSEYISAAVGGIMLDHVGPRLTAFIGELIFAVSIALMAYSSQSFQAYIPSIILQGFCVNIVAFPALTMMESWPGRAALVVAIVVGAQSGAALIPSILWKLWNHNVEYSFSGIWMTYLAAIWLPVSVLYILALPRHRSIHANVKEEELPTADSVIISPSTEKLPVTEGDRQERDPDEPIVIVGVAPEAEAKPDKPDHSGTATSVAPVVKSEKSIWSDFFHEVVKIDLVAMGIYNMLLMQQFAYYPSVVRDAISLKMSDFVGWMTPLQAIFSIVIGFAMDYTGTCYVMYGMAATLAFVSLSAGLGPEIQGLQYTVAVVFNFMQSASFNVKYTYVNEMYDPFNFGKLVGVLGIVGGIGVYWNAPITSSTRYKLIFLLFTGIAVFMAILTTFLFIRQKKGVTYKKLTPPSTPASQSPPRAAISENEANQLQQEKKNSIEIAAHKEGPLVADAPPV